jgi:hypothetical protein
MPGWLSTRRCGTMRPRPNVGWRFFVMPSTTTTLLGAAVAIIAPVLTSTTPPKLVGRALQSIRRRPITIDPRKQWAGHRSGRIANRLEPGRALCYLTDPGGATSL